MSIEVKNLLKIYGEQRAVNDISFAVGRGEIVGFLGPNGAGKSTTMKVLTGFLKQDAGTATVCGIDVSAQPIDTKKRIGYLPESNPCTTTCTFASTSILSPVCISLPTGKKELKR